MYNPAKDPHLASWKERRAMGIVKMRCPQCGREGYKPYLYPDGTIIDPVCGKCDHEGGCAYHLTPRDYFRENPSEKGAHTVKKWEPRQLKRIELEPSLVSRSMQHTDRNKLVAWLRSLPLTPTQREQLDYSLTMYMVGTTKDGGAVWWQVDENRVVRTGKVIRYGDDGHRLKTADGTSIGFNWVHSILQRNGVIEGPDKVELVQCLFGQHLLPLFPDAEIHLVESEKSALICSIFSDPNAKLWLACGGMMLLNETRLQPLMKDGRTIVIYPDHDGWQKWNERCSTIHYDKLVVSDYVERAWKEGVDASNADISDIILRRLNEGPTALMNDMVRQNPSLQSLINQFDLVPCPGK